MWLLEEKILFASYEFAKHFLKTFADFAFDPSAGCPGFDRKAWEAPERLWTNGCDWRKLHDNKIRADVTRGWLVKASGSYKFTEREFGTAIPLEEVKKALTDKYSGFAAWPGEFSLNAMGPTFWVDESKSPKSATVRETGIQTFSAHAGRASIRGQTCWALHS